MLIVRETFTAKPGQASKLARMFRKAFANEPGSRVMTDLVGNYNTVVVEMSVASLADWEKMMEEYKSGKKQMDTGEDSEWKNYTEMYLKGRREVFQVVE